MMGDSDDTPSTTSRNSNSTSNSNNINDTYSYNTIANNATKYYTIAKDSLYKVFASTDDNNNNNNNYNNSNKSNDNSIDNDGILKPFSNMNNFNLGNLWSSYLQTSVSNNTTNHSTNSTNINTTAVDSVNHSVNQSKHWFPFLSTSSSTTSSTDYNNNNSNNNNNNNNISNSYSKNKMRVKIMTPHHYNPIIQNTYHRHHNFNHTLLTKSNSRTVSAHSIDELRKLLDVVFYNMQQEEEQQQLQELQEEVLELQDYNKEENHTSSSHLVHLDKSFSDISASSSTTTNTNTSNNNNANSTTNTTTTSSTKQSIWKHPSSPTTTNTATASTNNDISNIHLHDHYHNQQQSRRHHQKQYDDELYHGHCHNTIHHHHHTNTLNNDVDDDANENHDKDEQRQQQQQQHQDDDDDQSANITINTGTTTTTITNNSTRFPSPTNNYNHNNNNNNNLKHSYTNRKQSSSSHKQQQQNNNNNNNNIITTSEKASRLAEGTIYALRDLALDEALELHYALRFWNERYDRPYLYYLELFGPIYWWKKCISFLYPIFYPNHHTHNHTTSSKQYYEEDYNHHSNVGRKISQLQAVLARRCSSIGQLQLHIWRAGWRAGVAQWGIVGQGNEWAAVAGEHGGIVEDYSTAGMHVHTQQQSQQQQPHHSLSQIGYFFSRIGGSNSPKRQQHSNTTNNHPPHQQHHHHHHHHRLHTPTNNKYYGDTLLAVRNSRGGCIEIDDSALAAWSIDAIRVVRDQLYLAGNSGSIPLPYYQNWPTEKEYFAMKGITTAATTSTDTLDRKPTENQDSFRQSQTDVGFQTIDGAMIYLPLWAKEKRMVSAEDMDVVNCTSNTNSIYTNPTQNDANRHGEDENEPQIVGNNNNDETNTISTPLMKKSNTSAIHKKNIPQQQQQPITQSNNTKIEISDLNLMASEVANILDSMEMYMANQRRRRLDKLKPPSTFVRRWYVTALIVPASCYVAYKLVRNNAGAELAKVVYAKIVSFCSEHVSEPLQSIYREVFTRKGRENATDRKAREDVIDILRKMIKSWLDETFPNMVEAERMKMATSMDMSLIELKQEDAIKNIFEINNIVRMSLIQMQFIKKEMMNALHAMDELMGSNEINMRIAAMTPAILVANAIRFTLRKLFYTLFSSQNSTTREETFASLRHLILDIERLLTMRLDPPLPPAPLNYGVYGVNINVNVRPSSRSLVDANTLATTSTNSASSTTIMSTNSSTTTSGEGVLNSDDLGMLMLLVNECYKLLWRNKRRFNYTELMALSEDLAELTGERGVVSVRQQLHIIGRMSRTYSFLKI